MEPEKRDASQMTVVIFRLPLAFHVSFLECGTLRSDTFGWDLKRLAQELEGGSSTEMLEGPQ